MGYRGKFLNIPYTTVTDSIEIYSFLLDNQGAVHNSRVHTHNVLSEKTDEKELYSAYKGQRKYQRRKDSRYPRGIYKL